MYGGRQRSKQKPYTPTKSTDMFAVNEVIPARARSTIGIHDRYIYLSENRNSISSIQVVLLVGHNKSSESYKLPYDSKEEEKSQAG